MTHHVVFICQHHHRAKDAGGFTVLRRGSGMYEWTTPLGGKYLRDPDPVFAPGVDSPENPENWWITDQPVQEQRLFTTPPVGHRAGPDCPATTDAATAAAGGGVDAGCRCGELTPADRKAQYLASQQRFEERAKAARADRQHRYARRAPGRNQRAGTLHDPHDPVPVPAAAADYPMTRRSNPQCYKNSQPTRS